MRPSLELIAHLADLFDVSLTATSIRYLSFCEEACAIVFSQDGYIKWFQGTEEFDRLELFVPAKSKLDTSSLAAAHFRNLSGRDESKRVRVSTWFEARQLNHDATVLEQSWYMPNYNAVLTLLWVDEDIEDDDGFWIGHRR